MKHRFFLLFIGLVIITIGLGGCADSKVQSVEGLQKPTTLVDNAEVMESVIELPTTIQTTSLLEMSTEEETTATTITSQSLDKNEENKFLLLNDLGCYIDLYKADSITAYVEGIGNSEMLPNEILNHQYSDVYLHFNDRTYMTKSFGVSFNYFLGNLINYEDIINHTLPQEEHKYFEVKVGDTFGELKVTEAFIKYSCDYSNGQYNASSIDLGVTFSGSVSTTGYITIVPDENEGFFVSSGDIYFIPDANSWGEIPIILIGERVYLQGVVFDSFYYCSDINSIKLGNVLDGSNDFNLETIPQDGKYYRATVTITNLKMQEYVPDHRIDYYGNIANVELIED